MNALTSSPGVDATNYLSNTSTSSFPQLYQNPYESNTHPYDQPLTWATSQTPYATATGPVALAQPMYNVDPWPLTSSSGTNGGIDLNNPLLVHSSSGSPLLTSSSGTNGGIDLNNPLLVHSSSGSPLLTTSSGTNGGVDQSNPLLVNSSFPSSSVTSTGSGWNGGDVLNSSYFHPYLISQPSSTGGLKPWTAYTQQGTCSHHHGSQDGHSSFGQCTPPTFTNSQNSFQHGSSFDGQSLEDYLISLYNKYTNQHGWNTSYNGSGGGSWSQGGNSGGNYIDNYNAQYWNGQQHGGGIDQYYCYTNGQQQQGGGNMHCESQWSHGIHQDGHHHCHSQQGTTYNGCHSTIPIDTLHPPIAVHPILDSTTYTTNPLTITS
ncbi:hypothetical protein HMI54_006893 [Coelomomyces lativittatus]|nr:hypothetical protein HMI54_006893 [Coelomomyces lativittatus]KAJ1508263.1 hypothetical protein HMI55_000439 [Coelomomyces lativittatus]